MPYLRLSFPLLKYVSHSSLTQFSETPKIVCNCFCKYVYNLVFYPAAHKWDSFSRLCFYDKMVFNSCMHVLFVDDGINLLLICCHSKLW